MSRVPTAFALVMCAVIAAVIAAIAVPGALFVAGGLSAAALLLGLVIATRRQRVVASILIGVGLSSLAAAYLIGARPTIAQLLSLNQDLIGMLAAVSFLGVIARSAPTAEPRLRGAGAVWRTAGVIHFTGSVINMSVVTIVGDHLTRKDGTLHPADIMLLSRGYATGAFWSPLWAGAAAVLVFAPTANFLLIIPFGLALAIATLALSMITVFRALGDDLATYRGYALSFGLLRIPLVLMAAVLAVHAMFPGSPVPRIVTLASVVITGLVLVFRESKSALRNFARQARDGLPAMRGEVTLFTSAGVLAVGVGALLAAARVSLPLPEYDVWIAWASILVTVLVSLVGVHPVISMGIIAAICAPLHPAGSLFAFAAMIGWGASAAIGPISGLQLYLSGRYRVDPLATTRRNVPYVVVALVLAWPALLAVSALSGP